MTTAINKRNIFSFHYLSWILVFLHGICKSKQDTFLEDVTLAQKTQIEQFKILVSSFLPHDYMKEDSYLLGWLKAKDYDLEAARDMLYKNIKWREKNNMDGILKEDWSSFENEYKYSLEGCDLDGRPVIGVNYGDWDIRKAAITGKSRRFMRYIDKYFEEINVFIRRAQIRGQNVTKFVQINEMSHYSMEQNDCSLCVPISNYFYQTYEDHFPGTIHKIIFVNTPAVFQVQWKLFRISLSKDARNSVLIYGRDKSEWQSQLHKIIKKDELTPDFGGNKKFEIDLKQLRTKPNATFQCN